MHLPDLEQAYFLQSLGLAIAHSFWQAGILWGFHRFIINKNRKLPASIKYNVSVTFVFTAFAWFIQTLFETYFSLLHNHSAFKLYHLDGWIFHFQLVDNMLPYLSIVYLLVLCYHFISLYKNLSYNRFLLKNGLNKAPIDIRLFANNVAFHLGIKKKIQVWMSEQVDVPSVTGFIKPIILLPTAIVNQLSIQQTEAILLHELAHIKRNDYLINILQSMVELGMFFNPFVISLGKATRKERENCCDDCVINFQYDRFEYAKALLCLEEQRQLLTSNFAITATNGKKNLLQRVKRLFDIHPSNRLNAFQKTKLATSGAILFLLILISLTISFRQSINEGSKNLSEETAFIPEFLSSVPTESSSKSDLRSRPITHGLDNPVPKILKKRATKTTYTEPESEFVEAFINEDLLSTAQINEAIPSQVTEKEMPNSNYIVKIEEQQSGKKQTSIYYFELKDREGKPALKPLIILNRSSPRIKPAPSKISKDSLQDTSNKKVKRKRITT